MATIDIRIHAIHPSADGVLLFDLRAADGGDLPPFSPGAHVDVHLPGGLVRSYSLANDSRERHRYVLGIQRENASRGGSAWLHDCARVGMTLRLSAPTNHFPLVEEAPHSILFAGGIGITPLWSMAQRLRHLGKPWTLHYRSRSRRTAALLDVMAEQVRQGTVKPSFSDDGQEQRLDIAAEIRRAPAGSHFYCCGPSRMLEAFEAACAHIDSERVHLEYFAAKEAPALEGNFNVQLARSGLTVAVAAGQTILDAVQAAGCAVASSCQQGICGACETRVIRGSPDHRDLVLSDAERTSGTTMMICCSGSLSPELVLDL